MTRDLTELLQWLSATVGLTLLVFLLLVLSVVSGLLHYFHPRWRSARLWWPRRQRTEKPAREPAVDESLPEPDPGEALPDLPAHVFSSLADAFAAEGRYAEAVRERLRAILRGLVERRAVEILPGMTVTEVARAAAVAAPLVEPPLRGATGIFSDIWYGQLPATAEHDDRMRRYAAEVDA